MRDFGDGEGLRKILQDFAASRVDQQASAEKVQSLKKSLDLILEELTSAHTNLAGLRQDGIEMVNKVGNIEELVGEIPEYKKRISTLKAKASTECRGQLRKWWRIFQKSSRSRRGKTLMWQKELNARG